MKRYIIIISVLLFATCHSGSKQTFVIGVSQCSQDLWRNTVNTEMEREASFYPDVELRIKSVKDDSQQQIRDIEELIESGIDLLVVSPNEARMIRPIVSKAYKSGIPVILFDRKIDSDDYTAYIGADNYQLAYELGLYVAKELGGVGNVVEMRGWRGSTADEERHQGFSDAIKEYKGIKVIAQRRGDFLRNTAQERMMELLRESNKPIDLIFAMNDQMALGAYSAAINFSDNRPFIVGIDAVAGEGGGIESISKGLIDASFIYPTGGDRVIDLAYKILTGENFQRENILNTAVVDRSNARVIQLQTDQIALHQKKIDKTNKSLNLTLAQYANQRTMLMALMVILALVFVLLFTQFVAFKAKIRTNKTLEKQKEQLIELQRQLEEATQAKLVFFTNISHEFRTPLSLIMGPVETLMADNCIVGEQRELLTLMHRNSRRMLSLISEIIEFRTIENGKIKCSFIRGDMRQFICDLNGSFIDFASRHGIDFSFGCEYSQLQMVFDCRKFEKIYLNLLSNAFKHTQVGRSISVELSVEGEMMRLCVFNQGEAIPADKIGNIFDRFFKVHDNDSGAGIGLALTRALVEDVLHGKISVESVDGHGTTFTVLLPLVQSDAPLAEDSRAKVSMVDIDLLETANACQGQQELFAEDEHNRTGKPIALVIEDNADLRGYMNMILRAEYTVVDAADGESGIDKAKRYIPDIIISDVMMPGIDGFQVCRMLKNQLTTSHIPIILLTACSLDEQKATGFEQGADAYIPKPFNADLLKIRARKLIESRRKMKEAFGNTLVDDSKQTTLAQAEQGFIDSFRKYVHEHISDADMNVDDIAREMGMSRVQLYRKVKSLTNYPPNELIRIVRLKRAAHLLTGAITNISEVAYQTGFSSPSYFTKCFKEFYKQSPSEYIEKSK